MGQVTHADGDCHVTVAEQLPHAGRIPIGHMAEPGIGP